MNGNEIQTTMFAPTNIEQLTTPLVGAKLNLSAIMGYSIELGRYAPGEYSLFTVYDASPKNYGWKVSSQWWPTTVYRTRDKEAVRRAVEHGYPITDDARASLSEPTA